MIEFVQDAAYIKKVDELFPGRVRIIGLGHTGIAACDQLMLRGSLSRDLWVVDTDQTAVDGAIVSSKHLIGRAINHGVGCSGDRDLAREIVDAEECLLTEIVHGADFLVLILGLAGATGVMLAEKFIALAHRMETKVIIVGVKPLPFEGKVRRHKAVEAISLLRKEAHAVLVLTPDPLTSLPNSQKNMLYGFHCLHRLLAVTAESIAQIVCKRGLIQLSFADLRSLYGRYSTAEVMENFWVSYAEDSSDSLDNLVPDLLKGPILLDPTIWKNIDHAIAVINGPRQVALSDVQDLVVELQRSLPVKLPIATSACLESSEHQPLRLVLLLARTAPATAPAVIAPAPIPAPARAINKAVSDTVIMPASALPSRPTEATIFTGLQVTVPLPLVSPLHSPAQDGVLDPEELAELAELAASAEIEEEKEKPSRAEEVVPARETPAAPFVATAPTAAAIEANAVASAPSADIVIPDTTAAEPAKSAPMVEAPAELAKAEPDVNSSPAVPEEPVATTAKITFPGGGKSRVVLKARVPGEPPLPPGPAPSPRPFEPATTSSAETKVSEPALPTPAPVVVPAAPIATPAPAPEPAVIAPAPVVLQAKETKPIAPVSQETTKPVAPVPVPKIVPAAAAQAGPGETPAARAYPNPVIQYSPQPTPQVPAKPIPAPIVTPVAPVAAPVVKKDPVVPVLAPRTSVIRRPDEPTVPVTPVAAPQPPASPAVPVAPSAPSTPTARSTTPLAPVVPVIARPTVEPDEEEQEPVDDELDPLEPEDVDDLEDSDSDEEMDSEPNPKRNALPKQQEMEFEQATRGRFEKSAVTIYRGEDLDQPAFRRRKLAIRL